MPQALVEAWRFTPEDVLIHALPIFHTHGLFVATNVTLMAGGGMIFLPKFSAGEVLDWMPRATALMGVPTFYTRLLDDPRLTREAAKGMRLFISGSAPLLADTHRAFAERTGHAILERYGMTETGMNTSNPYDGERIPGSVGTGAAGGRGARHRARERPAAGARGDRHDRGARAERAFRLLEEAGGDAGEFSRRRLLHHRRPRQDRRATATSGSSGAARTSSSPAASTSIRRRWSWRSTRSRASARAR